MDQKLINDNDQSASISLLGFLAFITVTVASLGLLGLVIFTVESRRKEISVRKIIGAGIAGLMILLSRGFIKLIVIAGMIAMPLGYILSAIFLQNFANRVHTGLGSIFICFLFLLLIGLSTIISQTYRACTDNPVKHLRNE
jgi:putative ABC transport system permease protein